MKIKKTLLMLVILLLVNLSASAQIKPSATTPAPTKTQTSKIAPTQAVPAKSLATTTSTTTSTTISIATSITSSTIATATSQTTRQLKIDSSEITWTGKKITGEHKGNIKLKDGFLLVNESGNIAGGEFNIDMTTITNTDLGDAEYNKKLTDHLKSTDFFSVDKFKMATLKITNITRKPQSIYDVAGFLTIKGLTKPIKFEGELTENSGVVMLSAKITIDRTQYDIRYGSGKFFQGLGDKLIHDTFDIAVKLTAKR